jgi:RNA polymerase sigma-70 factor (ECF subfamily)
MTDPVPLPTPSPGHQAAFPDTRWSVLLTLRDVTSEGGRMVLGELYTAYWYPVYAFVRRFGHGQHDAEDLTQGFFAHLLERKTLETATPDKGRFRSFLLGALKHYLGTEARRSGAWKRGGRAVHVPIDTDEGERRLEQELTHSLTPETVFTRAWLEALLRRATAALESEYRQAGKLQHFTALEECLTGGIEGATYEQIGAALDLTVAAVKNAVYRMRLRYRELVRTEIARTVAADADVDAELRDLFAVLAG